MNGRAVSALVLSFAALAVTTAASVPQMSGRGAIHAVANPTSAATLAPITEEPSPSPASTATTPKLLGHVFVSAFCKTFVEHFNTAARTMIVDDVRLDDASYALRDYESDFSKLDGASQSWNHRLQLIAALKDLLETIPKTQKAVDTLREQAKSTTDEQRRGSLLESAAQLQESVDHQRIVANEMQELVGMMLDTHTAEDTIGHGVSSFLDAKQGFNVNPGDEPVPHPGDSFTNPRRSFVSGPSALEQVLHMPRDRQLIANAETHAATAASRIVTSCDAETPPPSSEPGP